MYKFPNCYLKKIYIYLGSQINSKSLIQEEIRLRIQAGNRSLFANKKLMKNKDLNAASKLQIHKSTIRPTVTYGCETWAMIVIEQNRLLVFERRVLRKIYGPTQYNNGTWRIKTNEELEVLINKKKYRKIYKITKMWKKHSYTIFLIQHNTPLQTQLNIFRSFMPS
jgi:hypothetical protein